jgi:hypothetical protein
MTEIPDADAPSPSSSSPSSLSPSSPLPPPLVPAEVDLRDFAFMPLDVNRLLRSRTWLAARKRPELAFYLVNLWIGAWHEVPAGSLPDDPDMLAEIARCPMQRWRRLREDLLRGWVRCADGRLYHPVVAEKAHEAWARKRIQRERSRKGNAVRWGSRRESPEDPQGQGQGQGQGQRSAEPTAAAGDAGPDERALVDRALVDRAFAAWCEAARREGWPEPMFLNGPRRIALSARLAECGGLDGWRAALDACAAADFLRRRDGGFQRWFDLDWLLQPDKFTRLMEGRYAERHRSTEARTAEGCAGAAADAGGLAATLAALGGAGSGG